MPRHISADSELMANLVLSALEKVIKNSSGWKEPVVQKAILLSGMSVLIASIKHIEEDLFSDN